MKKEIMPREKPYKIIDGDKFYQCTVCGEFKSIDNFALDNRTKTGIQSKCKECCKLYYLNNKDKASKGCKIRYLSKRDNIDKEAAKEIIGFPEIRKQKYRSIKDGLFLCKGCNRYLKLDEFYTKQTLCKKCYSQKKKKYNREHKEENARKSKKWREDNSEKIIKYNIENRKQRSIKLQEYTKKMSEKYGYNRDLFHKKATEYIKNNGIYFDSCAVCGEKGQIILHHPSYEAEELWESVVPLCPKCHRRVHCGWFECPTPIKLTSLKSKQNNKNEKKYLGSDFGKV